MPLLPGCKGISRIDRRERLGLEFSRPMSILHTSGGRTRVADYRYGPTEQTRN